MEIKVNKVIEFDTGKFVVSFDSIYGAAEGLWIKNAPRIDSIYDVEIEIIDDVVWSINAHPTSNHNPKVEKVDKLIRIIAQLESIEEDGSCILRLGNSILMAEIKDIPSLEKGAFIEMAVASIRLFDSNM